MSEDKKLGTCDKGGTGGWHDVDHPKRIQRKRTKGWKMPPDAVYVGRPTIWGNPFKIPANCGPFNVARYHSIKQYRDYLPGLLEAQPKGLIESLRGKDLACWCPITAPCHADVLLEIANQGQTDRGQGPERV